MVQNKYLGRTPEMTVKKMKPELEKMELIEGCILSTDILGWVLEYIRTMPKTTDDTIATTPFYLDSQKIRCFNECIKAYMFDNNSDTITIGGSNAEAMAIDLGEVDPLYSAKFISELNSVCKILRDLESYWDVTLNSVKIHYSGKFLLLGFSSTTDETSNSAENSDDDTDDDLLDDLDDDDASSDWDD